MEEAIAVYTIRHKESGKFLHMHKFDEHGEVKLEDREGNDGLPFFWIANGKEGAEAQADTLGSDYEVAGLTSQEMRSLLRVVAGGLSSVVEKIAAARAGVDPKRPPVGTSKGEVSGVIGLEEFARKKPKLALAYNTFLNLHPMEKSEVLMNMAVSLFGPMEQGDREEGLRLFAHAVLEAIKVTRGDIEEQCKHSDVEPCIICGKEAIVRVDESGARTVPLCIPCITSDHANKQSKPEPRKEEKDVGTDKGSDKGNKGD